MQRQEQSNDNHKILDVVIIIGISLFVLMYINKFYKGDIDNGQQTMQSARIQERASIPAAPCSSR